MLKRDLIAALARKHKNFKVKDIDLAVRLVFETMFSALTEEKEIELRGFGSFRLRRYAPRKARNPGSGESVDLGPRKGVLFRPGLEIKERVDVD
ncbi:MAG: HU family DNA-binding protein [Pseudomonadota bacterium]